ncbi:MAG: nitroreductase family protein [Firmicutes bacterium]|nr:nitroreductase family protein [Bacillota bacterium]
MEFTELIRIRRSVRAYQEHIIDRETLEKILKEAQMAPSWKNQQTSRVYALITPESLEELRTKILPSFNAKSSAGACLLVTTFVKDVVGFGPDGPANELGNYWGAYDLGLHDAYMILAAADEGYDTLIMGLRDEAAIRRELEIPENEVIVSVIALGKRAQEPSLRPRLELSDTVRMI